MRKVKSLKDIGLLTGGRYCGKTEAIIKAMTAKHDQGFGKPSIVTKGTGNVEYIVKRLQQLGKAVKIEEYQGSHMITIIGEKKCED
jgi:hypothetical protein